jgi:hypothetical protein
LKAVFFGDFVSSNNEHEVKLNQDVLEFKPVGLDKTAKVAYDVDTTNNNL